MIAARASLMIVGLLVGGYGAVLLLDNPWVVLMRIAIWAAAGVVLHDFVFAPICVALGFAGRRLLPRLWWAPVAIAALCSVTLALLAVPVFDRPGARPDNPTVLDRDYHLSLWISLAIVWSFVPPYLMANRIRSIRTARRTALPADSA